MYKDNKWEDTCKYAQRASWKLKAQQSFTFHVSCKSLAACWFLLVCLQGKYWEWTVNMDMNTNNYGSICSTFCYYDTVACCVDGVVWILAFIAETLWSSVIIRLYHSIMCQLLAFVEITWVCCGDAILLLCLLSTIRPFFPRLRVCTIVSVSRDRNLGWDHWPWARGHIVLQGAEPRILHK